MLNFKYKLFGRSKGRKKNKNFLLNNLNEFDFNIKKDLNKKSFNILDIGSGNGENAIYLSKLYPNSKIITCEIFEDGNINLINQINELHIHNIRLFKGNALQLLDELKKNIIFNQVWILFPDPWPKNKHIGRRFINRKSIGEISRVLKPKCEIMLASDDWISQTWILQNFVLSISINHSNLSKLIFDPIYHLKICYSYNQKNLKK
mgnify:CR=1 FL=1